MTYPVRASLLALTMCFALSTPTLRAAPTRDSVPDPFYARLTGIVGTRTPITMNLSRHRNFLSGYYQYDKVGHPIFLTGELSGERFELSEYGNGNTVDPTGILNGVISGKDGKILISGSWKSPDGSKTLALSLFENWDTAIRLEAIAFNAFRKLEEKAKDGPHAEYSANGVFPAQGSAHRAAFSQRYFGNAQPVGHFGRDSENYFREYTDANLEPWLEYPDKDQGPSFSWVRDFSVTPVINDTSYIVLALEGYEFTGGAHGMPYGGFDTYDIKEGRFLGYGDFWKPGSEAPLSRILTAAFRSARNIAPDTPLEEAGCFVNELPFEEGTQFYLCKAGLTVRYQAYAILPYAEGLPTVFVPMKDIAAFLKPARTVFD